MPPALDRSSLSPPSSSISDSIHGMLVGVEWHPSGLSIDEKVMKRKITEEKLSNKNHENMYRKGRYPWQGSCRGQMWEDLFCRIGYWERCSYRIHYVCTGMSMRWKCLSWLKEVSDKPYCMGHGNEVDYKMCTRCTEIKDILGACRWVTNGYMKLND